MKKEERWKTAHSRFFDHFKYSPALPKHINQMDTEWADALEKSVKDDFDYTVDFYGTVPKPFNPNAPWPKIIVD